MRRISTAGLVVALFGFGLSGIAGQARAAGFRHACEGCGPIGVTHRYRTIHPVFNVTRYHDRSVYHYVTRLHYIEDVTRVQPIIQVHDVTRLHPVAVVRDAYAYPAQGLIPGAFLQQGPASYGCGCGD